MTETSEKREAASDLMERVKQLEDENRSLKELNDTKDASIESFKRQLEYLKADNQQLQTEVDNLNSDFLLLQDENSRLVQEINELAVSQPNVSHFKPEELSKETSNESMAISGKHEKKEDAHIFSINGRKYASLTRLQSCYVIQFDDNSQCVLEDVNKDLLCSHIYEKAADFKRQSVSDFTSNNVILKVAYDVLRPNDKVSRHLKDREEFLVVRPADNQWLYGDVFDLAFVGRLRSLEEQCDNIILNSIQTPPAPSTVKRKH